MNTPRIGGLVLTLLALGWLGPGCATRDLNPSRPRADTGYVDLRVDSPEAFSWEVARYEERSKTFARIFSEFEPPAAGVLRLALAPGHHRLRVTFLNRTVLQPAEVEVDVLDGRITPVVVTLEEAGGTVVVSKQETLGGTSGNLSGRRTKVQTGQAVTYRLSAMAQPPVAYRVKEEMPYARR